MSIGSKTTELLAKLLRETSKGTVDWEVRAPPRSLARDTEQSVPLFLQTEYKGKLLGIYDLRTKSFYDEHDYYWSEGVGFCILDNEDRVVWESDSASQALYDLFNLAREKASGIDDILDDLLEDD